jgi:hypothetical protein
MADTPGGGDMKVPGFGNVQKKYVIGGVAVGGIIAVVVYIRAKKTAAANAAAATNQTAAQAGTVTDPAGNTCATVDPNSGYCPGSPEDQSWQQENSGYYSSGGIAAQDAAGISSGVTGTSAAGFVTDAAGNQCTAVDPNTGYCPGTPQDLAAQQGSVTSTVPSAGTSAPTTNSQWLTDAIAVLPGGATSANEAALAGVLGGLTVTTAQKNIFLEAVGLEGQPPQGYPTPIKTSDSSGQPGTPAKAAGAVGGLSVTGTTGGITARWNATSGATGYAYVVRDLATHSQVAAATVKSTSVSVGGLKKGTDYNFGIQALPGGPGDNAHAVAK